MCLWAALTGCRLADSFFPPPQSFASASVVDQGWRPHCCVELGGLPWCCVELERGLLPTQTPQATMGQCALSQYNTGGVQKASSSFPEISIMWERGSRPVTDTLMQNVLV